MITIRNEQCLFPYFIFMYVGSLFYKIVIRGKERVEEKEQDKRNKVQALISISTKQEFSTLSKL